MDYLSGKKKERAESFFLLCADIALNSICYRAKGGSVIVRDQEIIGRGFNSPPNGITLDHCIKEELPLNFKSDRTCCVHAEQRAIIDALIKNPKKIDGSEIYYVRLNEQGKMAFAGDPYCTICSKLALDVGIAHFLLWHESGIGKYDTQDYYWRSFKLANRLLTPKK